MAIEATGVKHASGNVVRLPHGPRKSVPPQPRQVDEAAALLRPTRTQGDWLKRGLDQAGGKLPLFTRDGQRVSERTIRSCIRQGWAEPWFENPIKPDWLVCKLTDEGRRALADN